tara:strand:+ start:6242 stop:6613 length:372 start_codon:yes stop_codon:yes gene_type:complete
MTITKIEYNNLTRTNQILKNQIDTLQTDKQKTSNGYETRISYVNTQTGVITTINYYLFYLYLFCAFFITFLLYKNQTIHSYIKIAILVSMYTYPFIIYSIQNFFYELYNFVYSIFMGIPYKKK